MFALTLGGLLIGGTYGWVAWIYSYNREAWMNDCQILQAFENQNDNLDIATHTMCRDEVRDRTQATMTKLSSYILITTLVLSLAFEMLIEGQVPHETADFVLNVYMLCLGSAILYLILSVLFGVVATTMIYESSAELLTIKVPPPWSKIDVTMATRREGQLTRSFENKPWKELFLPPLMRTSRVKHVIDKMLVWRSSIHKAAIQTLSGLPWNRPQVSAKQTSASKGEFEGDHLLRSQADSNETMLRHARPPPLSTDCERDVAKRVGFCLKPEEVPSPLESTLGSDADGLSSGAGDEDLTRLHMIERGYRDRWKLYERSWAPLQVHSAMCVALGLKNLLEAYGYYCMATLFGEYGANAWAFWAVQIIFTSLNVLMIQFLFDLSPWKASVVAFGPLCCAVAATTSWTPLDRVLVPFCFLCHCMESFVLQGGGPLLDVDEAEESGTPLAPSSLGEEAPASPRARVSRLLGSCCGARVVASRNDIADNLKGFMANVGAPPTRTSVLCDVHEFDDDDHWSIETPAGSRRTGVESPSDCHDPGRPKDPRRMLYAYERRGSEVDERNRGQKTARMVRRLMRGGRFIVRSLWIVSVLWAIGKSLFSNSYGNSRAVLRAIPSGPPVAGVTVLETAWYSPYFRPRSLVCPNGRVFMADYFRVFELSYDLKHVKPYPCAINARIADITADCDSSGCWPVVLLDEGRKVILDCKTGKSSSLLSSRSVADRFALSGNGTLFTSHRAGDVVEYLWSSQEDRWEPRWVVHDGIPGGIEALDVVRNRLLLFGGGFVEVQDLPTGKRCGVWSLPAEILGAGCAFDSGATVLLLGRRDEDGSPKSVQLMCAELAGVPGCSLQDTDENPARSEVNQADVPLDRCRRVLQQQHLESNPATLT